MTSPRARVLSPGERGKGKREGEKFPKGRFWGTLGSVWGNSGE